MKSAGILLPISALPSKYGIGSFSKEAYEFVDFLAEAGQSYWQILPLGPTGFGDSPYQSFSSFAGNPYFISLQELINEGILTEEECHNAEFGRDERNIDYKRIYDNRLKLLYKAYKSTDLDNDDYFGFVSENVKWLEDYALFMALKEHFAGKSWYEWDTDIRLYQAKAVEDYAERLEDKVSFWKYVQYKFFKQWEALKSYANSKGIKIIGDIPIYVAYDSADAWSKSALFEFNVDRTPINVAGCPPDGFSKEGQLWGNPIYNWKVHKETNYLWWIDRIEHSLKLYDVVRIDHFRGFDEYYSIEYGSKDATEGEWRKGPQKALFDAIYKKLGRVDIIAEDLGFVTDTVKELLRRTEIPGMKVFQFGFDERDTGARNDYLPHNYNEKCVAYTGTHDNPTIVSWFFEITESERKRVRAYLCDHYTPDSEMNLPIIGAVMRSNAELCIIPIQDYLGYDSRARINKPSTTGGNWMWRLSKSDLTEELSQKIKEITALTGRAN
ncbi:MAG: 4-alpha-glucanotransferase [Clostridia bacterium]|nr:4-alpha-glucanotransferase [Clostridia bacterium]